MKPAPSLNFTGHQNADPELATQNSSYIVKINFTQKHLHCKDRFRAGKHRIMIAAFDPYCAGVAFDFDAGIFHFCGDGRFAG